MKIDTRIQAAVLFLACLVLQLYPLPFHAADSLRDPGDPLLNTWIMAWVQDNVFSDPRRLFDAPIFHPLENTLSFSEHLLPQALLSLPVRLAFDNPVLAYNALFFLSFFFAAYTMFLLVRRLTGCAAGGMISGLIFAFNSYHIDHVAHLQLISSGWIPLTFLFLHDFFESKKPAKAVLAALAFTLQGLSSVYYGLFLFSILILAVPFLLLLHRQDMRFPFLVRLAVPFLVSGIVLALFSTPYLRLIETYGFERPLGPGADLIHYLAPPPQNVVLGKTLGSLGAPERYLFPGFAAVFLAGVFLVAGRRAFRGLPRPLRIASGAFLLGSTALFLFGLLSGGRPDKPLLAGLVTGFLTLILALGFSIFGKSGRPDGESRIFFIYPILMLWALFLSMGSRLAFLGKTPVDIPFPFEWFHRAVPGFQGIREPSRYGIFVIFCLAVMAGFGLKTLLRRVNSRGFGTALIAALVLFVNLESLGIPQRVEFIPVRENIPPGIRWLGNQEGDFAVIDLPFRNPIAGETMSMYFSIFHGKRLVNGFSGFIPPSAFHVRQIFSGFPSATSCDVLDALGVKYVVLRPGLWNEETAKRKMARLEGDFASRLKQVREFRYELKKPSLLLPHDGRDLIYEVIPAGKREPEKAPMNLREIPPSQWTISSNVGDHLLPALKDGDLRTRWTTEKGKRTGDHLVVEFNEDVRVDRISFFPGRSPNDYALDFLVETSADGRIWHRIESGYSILEFLLDQIRTPRQAVQHLDLRAGPLRFLKITQIGDQKDFYWSVAELKLFTADFQ